MNKIHILPEEVANKIAAGEVVERPASIAKELIENSLDAGARSIEIEIRNGGKSLIRIADDGSGMSRSDALLAMKRHGTSKITLAEDLERIISFGFRGEALPSIAAVSRFCMLTAFEDEEEGTEIKIDGGANVSVTAAPMRQGTEMTVKDLFFNTPGRRKFLKTDMTEKSRLMDVVSSLALANPHVRFHLISHEKTVWDLTPALSLLARVGQLLGDAKMKEWIPIQGSSGKIKIEGLIGKPSIAMGNRNGQTLFVNRRWVRSLSLSYAIQDGFYGLLVHGQYARAVLCLDLDPSEVDVNVHPTKQEVRLSHEAEIRSLLKRLISEALLGSPAMAPTLAPKRNPIETLKKVYGGLGATPVHAAGQSLDLGEIDRPFANEPRSFPQELPPPITIRNHLRISKILGQIHHSFIVAETDAGLILVDQHAAHERVMFEALRKNFMTGKVERQALLMEEVIELSPSESECLQAYRPFLEKVGFEVDEFGDQSFVLRSFPAVLGDSDPVRCIRNFLEQKESGKMISDIEKQTDDLAALMACKRRSVKAHDPLDYRQMQVLLDRLSACENPFSCPHGRPSIIQYSFQDLETQFKR